MQMHTYAGHEVKLDDQGFMADAAEWSPEIAEAIAKEEGLGPLSDRHWTVIDYCRKEAADHNGEAPGVRAIAKGSGVDMKELYKLFPKGPGKLAAKVAGLGKPKACI